jgi:hypothetical protein
MVENILLGKGRATVSNRRALAKTRNSGAGADRRMREGTEHRRRSLRYYESGKRALAKEARWLSFSRIACVSLFLLLFGK